MEAGSVAVQAALIAGVQWCSWQGSCEGGGRMQKLSAAGGARRRCCVTLTQFAGEHVSVGHDVIERFLQEAGAGQYVQ